MDASLLSLFMPVFLVAIVHMIKPGVYIFINMLTQLDLYKTGLLPS